MKRKSFTVLVVEDDPDDQAFIKLALENASAKLSVRVLGSGNEAIEYLKVEGRYAERERFEYPSLILTDLKMPNGDGFAVLEFLKDRPEYAIIPTVVLTGSDDENDIQHSYDLGATAYLVKPSSFKVLSALMKDLVGFWLACEVPQVDSTGKRLETQSRGKLGARFEQ